MPTLACRDIPILIDYFRSAGPASILDIGAGNGVAGLIARDLLEPEAEGRPDPSKWHLHIDGIVRQPSDVHEHLKVIYNRVYAGRAIEIIDSLPEYDLVLIKDCLEYETEADALGLLENCIAHAHRFVILSVRIGKCWEKFNSRNPSCRQSSYWYVEDFTGFTDAYEIIDGPHGPYGIFPIIKDRYINHRIEQLSRTEYSAEPDSAAVPARLQLSRSAVAQIDLSRLATYVADEGHLHYFMDDAFQEHYRLIAYLSTCFREACIFDIGTNKGYSALALSYGPTNRVVSYDIVDLKDLHRVDELHRIEFRIGDVLEDERLLSSPLIMLDTDHDGRFESTFYNFLKENDYRGLLFLDDIHLCDAMIRFWNAIREPKADLTELGHFSGSGLVDFSRPGGF